MTPTFRQYARTMSTPNLCDSCSNGNSFPIVDPAQSPQKAVEVLSSSTIHVENLSDANTYRFRPNYQPYEALTVSFTLVAISGEDTVTNPVVKGTVIDTVELSWEYNKEVATQELTNSGELDEPTLDVEDEEYTYEEVEITDNTSFTISGNDGNGQDGSIASATRSITFGNYMLLGVGDNMTLETVSSLLTLLSGFNKVVKTSRAHTYNATGGINEHHFVAYPKSFGLATFKKGIFEGGYVRLKAVSSILKVELGEGDVESDIMFTNDKGHEEAFYVYMSLYDNQNDAVTPFVIS